MRQRVYWLVVLAVWLACFAQVASAQQTRIEAGSAYTFPPGARYVDVQIFGFSISYDGFGYAVGTVPELVGGSIYAPDSGFVCDQSIPLDYDGATWGFNPSAYCLVTPLYSGSVDLPSFWDIPLPGSAALLTAVAAVLASAFGMRQLRKALS